jgi:glycosyltransferase involved in cell wall biosynthesis
MTSDFRGCGFYRMYQPLNHLAKNYDVKVTINTGFWKTQTEKMSDDELKAFDCIVWQKSFFDMEDIRRAKQLKIPVVVDFDDHWFLNDEHQLRELYKKDNTSVKLHKLLLYADYVTCTTELLAEQIYQHNKNVIVLPNAMDMNYPGCHVERVKEDPFCFGYLGGHFHIRDVALLTGLQAQLTRECKNYRLRLFGFDGTSVYTKYADVLSDNCRSKNFDIYKGRPIFTYPQFYNLMDCSLVPLEANRFNRYKSELKLIEAGFFKKAVIVSNVDPYRRLINGKNCLKVETSSDWFKHCKRLIENRSLATDLGEALYESVQKYSIDIVNKKRYKFYQDVCKKLNINSGLRLSRVEILN